MAHQKCELLLFMYLKLLYGLDGVSSQVSIIEVSFAFIQGLFHIEVESLDRLRL